MRRGKINKTSFILIFFVAFFTILSYGFDQLVIRSEDKIRNLKIEYQNIDNSFTKLQSIISTLDEISLASDLNFSHLILRRNLLIKSYLLSRIELGDSLKFFNRKNEKVNTEDLGRMMLKELIKVADMQYEIRSQYRDFYVTHEKYLKKINNEKFSLSDLFENDLDPFIDKRGQFFNQNLIKYTKLFGYNYHWKDSSYEELVEYRKKALKNFTEFEWFDVYRYKMMLLKEIKEDTIVLENFTESIDLRTENLEKKLIEKFDQLKKSNVNKNFFILLSIISQIFSLLFLLFLFRSFLTK